MSNLSVAALVLAAAAGLVACGTTKPVPATAAKPSTQAASKAAAAAAGKASAPTGPAKSASIPATPAPPPQAIFLRPVPGATISAFDGSRNKGIDIGGKSGDPVLAAGDGRVVYAGAGLRGYGNLVFIKHNETFLTAYAHNRVLLVKENQLVRQGQKIAEMGQTETDRVKLHFEVRRQGVAVNPEPYFKTR